MSLPLRGGSGAGRAGITGEDQHEGTFSQGN